MTLPEHAICSVMIAQFGVRQRMGAPGVIAVTVAGVAPDFDLAAKFFGDPYFWQLHHALGHNIFAVGILSAVIAAIGSVFFRLRPYHYLFGFCCLAATVHCLTDSLYWWGIQPLWPFSAGEICFNIIEYLDLLVLGLWLSAAVCLYKFPDKSARIAGVTLTAFAAYVLLRAALPAPTGWFKLITGGWMYEIPQRTPVFDWW